jgi:hypothetical protein
MCSIELSLRDLGFTLSNILVAPIEFNATTYSRPIRMSVMMICEIHPPEHWPKLELADAESPMGMHV